MLEKLDFANIPNNALVGAAYKNTDYDPAGEYSVGYMSGTVGIIYNSAMVEGEPDSWALMFDEKYSGQLLQFDNPRDAFGIALKYLGFSLNTTDESKINAAFALLKTQKPLLQAYVMDTIFDKMEGGEAAIGAYYAGDFLTMRESNPDLRFVLPVEGSNRFEDAMCVPKGSPNKKNAELFINFMAGTEVALRNTEATGYLTVNTEAALEYGDSLDDEAFGVMFPDDKALSRCEVFLNLPQETLDLYDRLWVELKS
jgi:spermidine/putrescine transport system substrate-binding protein